MSAPLARLVRALRSRLRLILGLGISAVFIYLALPGLRLDEFLVALRGAQYWWIVPGVAVYFVGVWARTWRWHYMLRHLRPVPMGPLFRIVCIGYMGNNIYPARAGEVLRSVVLKQEHGISISASLATVLIERLFDGREVGADITFEKTFQGYRGIVHGGLLSTVLDEAMVTLLNRMGEHAVTAELTVRFLAPAGIGEPFRATGRIRKLEARLARTDGTEVARARSTCIRLGPLPAGASDRS